MSSPSNLPPADLAAIVEMLSHEAIANRADGEPVGRAFAWLRDAVERGEHVTRIPAHRSGSLFASYLEAFALEAGQEDATTLRAAAAILRAMFAPAKETHG